MKRNLIKLPSGAVKPMRPDPLLRIFAASSANTPKIPTVAVRSLPPYIDDNSNDYGAGFDVIAGSNILLFGAGALGSHAGYFLAAFSVNFDIIDFDHVEHKHTCLARTSYEPSQVGYRKVLAFKDKVERDYPNSKVHPWPYNVKDLADWQIRELAQKAHIVINAIDDPPQMVRVNDLLYNTNEILYAALHTSAASGHLIITYPGKSACLRCCLQIKSSDDITTLHAEPAAGLDIRHVANQCATIAADIILSKVTGKPIERWDTDKNIFYFANKREQLSPDGPGVHMQKARKMPQCPICSASSQ